MPTTCMIGVVTATTSITLMGTLFRHCISPGTEAMHDLPFESSSGRAYAAAVCQQFSLAAPAVGSAAPSASNEYLTLVANRVCAPD